MKTLYSFPAADEPRKKGDQFMLPSGLWCDIPDECLDEPIGSIIVRRPVATAHNIDTLLATAEEIKKTAENLASLFGIEWKPIKPIPYSHDQDSFSDWKTPQKNHSSISNSEEFHRMGL